MKQIIKAIWKSNEVPTNEYFLWLKYEDGGFILYVRGQKGWEPITSKGQISDTYTKEEIDNILDNYYTKEQNDEKYLPLSAGPEKGLTGTLYAQVIRPRSNGTAFGSRDENSKYTPYIFPARTLYDSGRWGVKKVFSYAGGESETGNVGTLDIIIPAVTVIKYHITISGGYENPILSDMHIYILQNSIVPIQAYHSGKALVNGNNLGSIRIAKTLDNKLHLLIGNADNIYPPMSMIEIEVVSTTTGQLNIDNVANGLTPNFITDTTEYTVIDYLTHGE